MTLNGKVFQPYISLGTSHAYGINGFAPNQERHCKRLLNGEFRSLLPLVYPYIIDEIFLRQGCFIHTFQAAP